MLWICLASYETKVSFPLAFKLSQKAWKWVYWLLEFPDEEESPFFKISNQIQMTVFKKNHPFILLLP